MPLKLTNNAASRLASALTASATTVVLKAGDGAKFPVLSAGDWFPLTLVKLAAGDPVIEIVKCTARTGDALTVVRAQEGTAATTFSADDRAENRLTAGAMSSVVFDYAVGSVVASATAPSVGVWLKAGFFYAKSSYPTLANALEGAVAFKRSIYVAWLNSVATSLNFAVAVGDGKAAFLDWSGSESWSDVTIPSGNYQAVTFASGLNCVAVGANICATTVNPSAAWTARTIPSGSYLAVAQVGSVTVAVGLSCCATSADNGVTWTARTIPAGTYRSICVLGSLLVAVGDNVCATSSDNGVTWVARAIDLGQWNSVSFVGSTLFAVGGNLCSTSADNGVTWTQRTIPAGTYFSAISVGSTAIAIGNACATSIDGGVTWVNQSLPAGTLRSAAISASGQIAAVSASNLAPITGRVLSHSASPNFYVPSVENSINQWVRAA